MIASKADVKILAALYSILGEGEPTTSTEGEVGDIYVDIDEDSDTYGNSYRLHKIAESGDYIWERENTEDKRIDIFINRAERDYLSIRGRAFETDDDGKTIYPDGADIVGAEMVCYLLGAYEGRGKNSDGIGGRSNSYEKKIAGYPVSIVGQIDKYVEVG